MKLLHPSLKTCNDEEGDEFPRTKWNSRVHIVSCHFSFIASFRCNLVTYQRKFSLFKRIASFLLCIRIDKSEVRYTHDNHILSTEQSIMMREIPSCALRVGSANMPNLSTRWSQDLVVLWSLLMMKLRDKRYAFF